MTTPTSPASRHGSFSPFVLACFSLNYILGTGFLSLPWAFYHAGIILSVAVTVGICTIAYISSEYLLTAMARADRIIVLQQNQQGVQAIVNDTNGLATSEYGSLIVPHHRQITDSSTAEQPLLVGDRRIDIPELTQIFLGNAGFRLYSLCVSMYIFGAMTSFTTVFGCALASIRWNNLDDHNILYTTTIISTTEQEQNQAQQHQHDFYPFYIALYAVIVVPLSCLELYEQKLLQVILTASRIVMMVLMITTPILAAMFPYLADFGDAHETSTVYSPPPLVNVKGIHQMLPIMVFAAIFQFSIPSLAEQMTHHKEQIHHVFAWAFLLVAALYGCIGMVDAWYFGSAVAQSVNTNWASYTGNNGPLPQWISMFVVLFPAINVISTFPLHALILGDSLMSVVYGRSIEDVKQNRWITIMYRLAASIPPIILGLLVRELGRITGYTGLMGLAIAFMFPPWLLLASNAMAIRYDISTQSQYESCPQCSTALAAKTMLVFGGVSIVFVFGSFLMDVEEK